MVDSPLLGPVERRRGGTLRVKVLLAHAFSAIFLALSIALAGFSVFEFLSIPFRDEPLVGNVLHAINTAVIALATFELWLGIAKEYTKDDAGEHIYHGIRRSIARFVSVGCTALVLESLIMVIKYSQLELAGNLYYPVAIVAAAALLLMALGVFLHLTRPDCN